MGCVLEITIVVFEVAKIPIYITEYGIWTRNYPDARLFWPYVNGGSRTITFPLNVLFYGKFKLINKDFVDEVINHCNAIQQFIFGKADLLEVMTETVENLSRNNAGERKNTEPAELEPYLTREEVCRMLKVSLTTLWRWNLKEC